MKSAFRAALPILAVVLLAWHGLQREKPGSAAVVRH